MTPIFDLSSTPHPPHIASIVIVTPRLFMIFCPPGLTSTHFSTSIKSTSLRLFLSCAGCTHPPEANVTFITIHRESSIKSTNGNKRAVRSGHRASTCQVWTKRNVDSLYRSVTITRPSLYRAAKALRISSFPISPMLTRL